MSAIPSAASLLMYLDTVTSIYQQELDRLPTHGELAHYLWAILALGHTGDLIRAEVRAVKPVAPPWTKPGRAEVLANLRGDLCHRAADGPGETYVRGTGQWEYLGLSDADWQREASYHVPLGQRMFLCNLRQEPYPPEAPESFDLSMDVGLAKARLERAYASGMIPHVNVAFFGEGDGGLSLIRMKSILPQLRDHICAVLLGFEVRVDGGASIWSPGELLRAIEVIRGELGPDVVIGFEPLSDDSRTEPVVWDGRVINEPRRWYTETAAREIDVLHLRLPNAIIRDPRKVCDEVGGAVYRLQGRFDHPTHWPEGDEIPAAVRENWRNDYGLPRPLRVCLTEFASFLEWSTGRKRALREYVQRTGIPISGYGEG